MGRRGRKRKEVGGAGRQEEEEGEETGGGRREGRRRERERHPVHSPATAGLGQGWSWEMTTPSSLPCGRNSVTWAIIAAYQDLHCQGPEPGTESRDSNMGHRLFNCQVHAYYLLRFFMTQNMVCPCEFPLTLEKSVSFCCTFGLGV